MRKLLLLSVCMFLLCTCNTTKKVKSATVVTKDSTIVSKTNETIVSSATKQSFFTTNEAINKEAFAEAERELELAFDKQDTNRTSVKVIFSQNGFEVNSPGKLPASVRYKDYTTKNEKQSEHKDSSSVISKLHFNSADKSEYDSAALNINTEIKQSNIKRSKMPLALIICGVAGCALIIILIIIKKVRII